ncbi:hypothetical protein EYF80_025319 [Liparis tanakae]|uniref:Uncharacterized protein n=1 Tax=Liparis tanakae TaxID=230148 RepID=A0A4Z2HF19_9TELE|nr:hypothetical protein EYF80_025319 [Liparis tanakae]
MDTPAAPVAPDTRVGVPFNMGLPSPIEDDVLAKEALPSCLGDEALVPEPNLPGGEDVVIGARLGKWAYTPVDRCSRAWLRGRGSTHEMRTDWGDMTRTLMSLGSYSGGSGQQKDTDKDILRSCSSMDNLFGAQNVTSSAKSVLLAAKAILRVARCGATQQLDAEGWDTPALPPSPPAAASPPELSAALFQKKNFQNPIMETTPIHTPLQWITDSILWENYGDEESFMSYSHQVQLGHMAQHQGPLAKLM